MLNVNTTLGALLLAGVTALSGAAQAQDFPPLPAAIKEAGKIRIGVKCDSPPFGASGPDGKPLGIEIEMARKIGTFAFGSEAGAELSCVTSEARIPSLNSGKLDLILATLGRTPARMDVIDYSDIYFWGSSNVLVPADSPVKTLADLSGKTVIVVKGATQIKWLEANIPGIEILQLNTTADGVQALKQGRADGFVGDGGLVYTLAGNYPETRVVEEGLDLGVNGIGLRKNEPELKAFVDAALDELRKDGFYERVIPEFVKEPAVAEVMKRGFLEAPPQL
ncbi:transporter substrate-binding domain-containing protein [Rhodobacter capsulatus]|jgi:polar amino acid transport system substrate-binding protein|uniref:Polar amino acid ABC transporter, periplasmic polar amino acid-binding protein n=2 Tax=Rhodobacter capsulatus TaxID=1061 RepID=D5AVC6_RHOCB|nr:transporter substrate-binding domain-containing protein [Rhodobacter capsulatus]ADE87261.1 polar amino acid ABC transporter, periplasmic polar amino acid-binding protein [Rhodobacter capsulatus SB 1003]MDS0927625.1 transporter substrate-binding domain-containing protein [Rhodobacter capsulatus]